MKRQVWQSAVAAGALLLGAVMANMWQRVPDEEAPAAAAPLPADSAQQTDGDGALVEPPAAQQASLANSAVVTQPVDAIVAEPEAEVMPQEPHHEAQPQPSPAVVKAIAEAKRPAPGEGAVTTYPDGSQSINLGNRYLSAPVATVGKDGKVHVDYHGEKYVQEKPATKQDADIKNHNKNSQ